jgi:RNAse (barnase) inhibitor barstar
MSDHFIVRAKIKLRLSVEWRKKTVSIKRFNTEDLKNQEIKRQYKNKLKETLRLTESSNNVDSLWNEIENSVKTAATEVLGFEKRKTRKKWFDEQCKKASNERDIARIKMLKNPSEENKRVLSVRQRETKQLFRKKKRTWENSRLEIIENSYKNNVRLFFEKANEIKNGFKAKATIIKDEEGLLITDKKKAANEFKNMFEKMLNQPTQVDVEENLSTVEQRLDEPTVEEVERAVGMLKNGKAPGEDSIVAELLKEGGKELMAQLKRLVDNVWKQEEIPTTWHMSVLCPVHKKGDAMICQNYRGISLLNTCYKIVSNIILNRIKPYTREIIGEYQSGFMPGKSTVDQIHTIKQIVEKSHEFDIDVHLLFVDFKQAYDSVNRYRLWKAMTQLGIPTKLVRLVKACVQKSKCKVKFNGELSEDFSVETGLRQGDALSPTLFNIALESVVREVLDDVTGLRIGEGHQITLAAYADDIIIIGETEEDLKWSAEKLISKGKEIGLQVNEEKTKYLIVSRREQVQNSLVVGGFTFERVSNFKYLGVDVNQQANSHEEIKRRITAGNKSYFALVPVFKSRLISKNTKIRLYKVLIRPIVLYACGAWASTKSDEKRLLLFERKILRRIYGPKRIEENIYERRTNAELRAIFNEPNIVGILKSRRISWAGHVWRAEGQTVHDVTMWKPNKKRPIGRPRQRWTDRVREDLKLLGIREGEQLAKNRELWRGVVEAAMDLQGPE